MNKIIGKLRGFSFFNTFKHASVYFSGTLLIQGLGIISLPVFTYFMNEDQYGIANIYLSYTTVATVLLSLNLHWSITRYSLEPEAQIKGFLATMLSSITLLFIVFGIGIYFAQDWITALMRMPAGLLGWMLLFTYTNVIWLVYYQLRIAENKSRELTILQVILQYAKFGMAVVGLWYWGQGHVDVYLGKVIGELIAGGLICLWVLYLLWPYLAWREMRWAHLQYAFQYSFPLIPYALGGYILTSFDQWYINSELGHGAAGLYSFAYKIGVLLLGLLTALQNASVVQYTQWMDEKKYNAVRDQVLSIHKVTILAAIVLILFSVDAGTLLSGKASFRSSLGIVPVIVGGYVFYGIALLYTRCFNYLKTNIYLTFIVLAAGAFNIWLNILFIKDFGYEAAAYTTLASYILMAVLAWAVSTLWLKMPSLPLGQMLLSLIPLIALTLLYYWLGWHSIGFHWGIVAVKGLVTIVFAVLLFYKTIRRLLGAGVAE